MPDALTSLSDALSALVAGAAPSVVAVRSHRAQSSGFHWRPGLIVTADEALAEEGEVSVTPTGSEPLPATVVGRDPGTDVALLRLVREDLPVAALHHGPPPPGALAVALGARDGGPVAALGAVALRGPAWRSMRGGEIDLRVELDLSLRGSSEGGLALDAAGRAFGMAVLGPRRRALVIPTATLERTAEALLRHGRVLRGYLGLRLQPTRLDGEEAGGVMVMAVDRGGPGAAAGLHQGDIITALDGETVTGVQALLRRLGPDSVGRGVILGVRRGGATREVALTVGERPLP
jgi:S1-C subfamily serine protease